MGQRSIARQQMFQKYSYLLVLELLVPLEPELQELSWSELQLIVLVQVLSHSGLVSSLASLLELKLLPQ
jgi:hypothetical protein